MRVFLTGASGFIGTAVIKELLAAGHHVTGLARSDASAQAIAAAGASVHRGDIEDLDSLRSGAAASEGVIHCAFNHDFSKYLENCENDRKAVTALADALVGSNRPLLVTAGTGLAPGRAVTEADPAPPSSVMPRSASAEAAAAASQRGVNVSTIRLPQVHDPLKQGLVTPLIAIAREKGVSAYMGDGLNRWPAAHVGDVAVLYRLALEQATPGRVYNAVAEEGVRVRDIAEVIGKRLALPVVSKTPEEAAEHFGWLGVFVGLDLPASSARTREQLDWHPTGPGLMADLEQGRF